MAHACVATASHGPVVAAGVLSSPPHLWACRLRPAVCAAAKQDLAGNADTGDRATSDSNASATSVSRDSQTTRAAPVQGPPRALTAVGGGGGEGEHDAHKQLNARICAASSADEVLAEVGAGGQRLVNFNMVNAVTAFHRLAKHGMRLPPGAQPEVAAHPAASKLVAWLEAALAGGARLSEMEAAQLLWAHAQLRHGSPTLVDAVYAQLDGAVVLTRAGTSSGSSSAADDAGSRGGDAAEGSSSGGGPPMRLSGGSAAVMLAYAMVRLQRPHEELLGKVVAALLSDDSGDGGEAARKPAPQQERQAEGPEGGVRRPEREGLGAEKQPRRGISLANLDPRSLCLLVWSLAHLQRCPPRLLTAACARLLRCGLHQCSVQSMTQVLTAMDLVEGGSWDQPLVEAVCAELAGRQHAAQPQRDEPPAGGRRRHQQELAGAAVRPGSPKLQRRLPLQQQGVAPFRLNEIDAAILARCLTLAWQAAVAASPDGATATESRQAMGRALQRHVAESPARRAALRLLLATAQRLAPRLRVHSLSALAYSFACLGSCPPELLEALAERAVQLEREMDAQAVASLSWAYCTLRYDHPQLYASLAAASLRLLGCDGEPEPDGGYGHESTAQAQTDGSSPGPGAFAGGQQPSAGALPGGTSKGSSADGGGFNAQTVSVVLHSFASANRCSSPQQRRLVAALAARAEAVLPDFSPQGLSNLAWGLTVAACYPPQLLRRWRSAAAAAAPSFKPAELNQLHIVEVALRLEAPGIGLDLPREAAGFFDGLYRTGRLRGLSGGAWQRTLADGPRSVTQFQLQVYEAMRALGAPCQLEWSPAGEYSIDIALPQQRIAVEADGPHHFASNSRHIMGGTVLKRRLLKGLGWRAVDVPFYDWWGLGEEQQREYMRRKLEAAGLRVDAADQQRAEQREEQEEGRSPLAAAAAPPAVAAPAAGHAAAQLAQADGVHASSSSRGDPGSSSDQQPGAEGVSVAQRAQRLSMLQYRQGKLSRKGLLTRSTMQAAASGANAPPPAASSAATGAPDAGGGNSAAGSAGSFESSLAAEGEDSGETAAR